MAPTVTEFCVRTVSHAPGNPGQTWRSTGIRRRISMLREVVDRECVGAFQCASARTNGINFQACSIDHSDISPFRINDLRTVRNSVAQNPPSNRTVPRCCLYSGVCGRAEIRLRGNCVRPLNVRRSLTGTGRHALCRRALGTARGLRGRQEIPAAVHGAGRSIRCQLKGDIDNSAGG